MADGRGACYGERVIDAREAPKAADTTRGELATELRARSSEILAAWIVRFERSPLRFRRATKAATHTAQVANLLETLTEAAHGGAVALVPGSDATRELERSSAFMGAQFASEGATGFDVSAVLLELREVVAGMVARRVVERRRDGHGNRHLVDALRGDAGVPLASGGAV